MTPSDAAEVAGAAIEAERRSLAYSFLQTGHVAAAALAPYAKKKLDPLEWVPSDLRREFFPSATPTREDLDAAARAAGFDPHTGKPLARA